MDDFDDARLMERMGAGDREALAALVRRHQHQVLGLCTRYLGDPEEARDLAQEVFIRLWRMAPRYVPRQPLPALLRTLSVHLCLDHHRKARPILLPDLDERPGERNPESEAAGAERKAALASALSALPDSQRMAVVLFHLEGLPVEEVAHHLDVSRKAAESLLSRARASLRQRLRAIE